MSTDTDTLLDHAPNGMARPLTHQELVEVSSRWEDLVVGNRSSRLHFLHELAEEELRVVLRSGREVLIFECGAVSSAGVQVAKRRAGLFSVNWRP